MEYTIELKWKCENCSTVNLGRLTECVSCGNPRDLEGKETNWIDVGNDNPEDAVKDVNLLKIFSDGADKYCLHCGASNRRKENNCDKCGSDISVNFSEEPVANSPASSSIIQGSFRAENSPNAPRSSADDRGIAPETERATGSGKRPSMSVAGAYGRESLSDYVSPSMIASVLIVAAAGTLLFFALKTFVPIEYNAAIVNRHWNRTVNVEKWSDFKVNKRRIDTVESVGQKGVPGFKLIPETCASQIDSYIDVPCGTYEECSPKYRTVTETNTCTKTKSETYTCGTTTSKSCTNNRNGSKTCKTSTSNKKCTRSVPYQTTCVETKRIPDGQSCKTRTKYCKQPVYAEYCDYISQKWTQDYSATLDEVNSKELLWPKITINNENQRINTSEYYAFDVLFDDLERSLVVDLSVYERYREKNTIRISYTSATSQMLIVEPELNEE